MPPTPVAPCCISGPYTLPTQFSEIPFEHNVHDTARTIDCINIHAFGRNHRSAGVGSIDAALPSGTDAHLFTPTDRRSLSPLSSLREFLKRRFAGPLQPVVFGIPKPLLPLHDVDRVGVSRLLRRVGLAVVDDGVMEEDQGAGFHLRRARSPAGEREVRAEGSERRCQFGWRTRPEKTNRLSCGRDFER